MKKPDSYINKIIFSEYLVQKKIGRGSFGTVYEGIITTTNQKIAIKLEKKKKDDSGLLETEACRLYLMQGEGIPKIICYGNNKTHNILIQELLGKSLEELFNLNKRKFTLKTVCSIGIEMIKRIKFVHSKFHLHRDIKPDNFMTGREKNDDKIYIIDFGLAKKYYSSSKKQHIKFCIGKNLIGTARYCGRNAHRGFEQGRRDDIESIGYVLMYFLNGVLPWQGLKVLKNEDHFEKIAEKKYNTTFEELTKGNPEEFLLYFQHCDSLKFEDEPNYDYLISLFKTVINKYCIDCLYDYDWKKNTIPNLSGLSPIKDKDKEEENNNKDISLLVHNNVSAIESKGEGKEEDKDNHINIKLKKDVFIGEDKNNHNNNEQDNGINQKIMKKNKSSNLLIPHGLIKDNLDLHNNEAINVKENNIILNNFEKKNNNKNIFIVNNAITPNIQNININININENLQNNLNKGAINMNEKIKNDLFNNLYNNGKIGSNKVNINNHHQNIFNKKDIKKEYFFSYDENMDDMVQSNNNTIENIKIDYEKEYKLDNKLKKVKFALFQQPKKLENIFTEDDIKSEEMNDTNINIIEKKSNEHNSKNENKNLNNSINNNDNKIFNNIKTNFNNSSTNINNDTKKENKKTYQNKSENNSGENKNKNKAHNHHYSHHKHHHHHSNRSSNNTKNNNINIQNDNKNENKINNLNENGKDKVTVNMKAKSSKELNKTLNYSENKNIEDPKLMNNEKVENTGFKGRRRNRVKSVDNKLSKNCQGCHCNIF